MLNNRDIDILITGDFYICNRAKKLLNDSKSDGILDLSDFKDIDYKCTNLEGACIDQGKKVVKSGPSMQNPEEAIHALRKYGFNLLCLANNHIMDYDKEGLFKTITLCEANGMHYVGAGENIQKASEPYIIDKEGFKLAILNMAENEFGGATESGPGFYGYDPVDVFYAITEVKKKTDNVLVIFHGGHELYPYPSPAVQKRYRFLIDAGANAVIAHHTHCYSGYEQYNNGLIVYSLGNFIFDYSSKTSELWNFGFAIKLTFSKEKELQFEIHPYRQFEKEPKVLFMKDEEKRDFFCSIQKLNEVIIDSGELQKEWDNYLRNIGKKYLAYIEVPNNKYIRGARYYRLLPGWLTKHHKALILNLVRCESHVEIMKSALNESLIRKKR